MGVSSPVPGSAGSMGSGSLGSGSAAADSVAAGSVGADAGLGSAVGSGVTVTAMGSSVGSVMGNDAKGMAGETEVGSTEGGNSAGMVVGSDRSVGLTGRNLGVLVMRGIWSVTGSSSVGRAVSDGVPEDAGMAGLRAWDGSTVLCGVIGSYDANDVVPPVSDGVLCSANPV